MSIQQEISIVISAFFSGVMVCMAYNILRILRRLLGHSLFWIAIEDLCYWIWCGIYLFAEIHRTCSGQIRWYYVAGASLGAVSSGMIVSKFIKKRIDKSTKTS